MTKETGRQLVDIRLDYYGRDGGEYPYIEDPVMKHSIFFDVFKNRWNYLFYYS